MKIRSAVQPFSYFVADGKKQKATPKKQN